MGEYFCGWYYRCQSDNQTLAIIPSVHQTGERNFCTIQLITDTSTFHTQFPYDNFQKNGDEIRIGSNQFGKAGIWLDIHAPDFRVEGAIGFSDFTPIRYDIMGPFQYVPFMQCRHSVYSMRHRVDGQIRVNGAPYVFDNAVGYLEGDRGHSFPKEYVWTQCSFPEGALMLSVADIPLGRIHFTGVIGIVLLRGKEYRLATYLGAKAVSIKDGEVIVRQGRFCLCVKQLGSPGHPLQAPVGGAMTRTIHEHPSCKVYYRFTHGDVTLLELEAPNAAFEYEY
ncbi:MAG: hypothetical protein J6A74_05485 [Oscillospiraceae bacterium]|nr:hypothetical protein [Oscillospiraceae bacterium]